MGFPPWGKFGGLPSRWTKIGCELRRWWGVQGTLAAELECAEQLWIALFSHQKPSGSSQARHSWDKERARIQELFLIL